MVREDELEVLSSQLLLFLESDFLRANGLSVFGFR